jgi:hypothetical protein
MWGLQGTREERRGASFFAYSLKIPFQSLPQNGAKILCGWPFHLMTTLPGAVAVRAFAGALFV